MKHLTDEREVRTESVRLYVSGLLTFARWWKRPLSEVTWDDAVSYKTYVRAHYACAVNELHGPRLYLKWKLCRGDKQRLLDRTYLPEVCTGFKMFRRNENGGNGRSVREMSILTVADIETLIQTTSKFEYAAVGQRDACLIALLYSTGFRASELLSMRVKDLYLEDGTWRAHCPKSKTIPRTVQVLWGVEYAELWKAHRQNASPDDPLWTSWNANTRPFRNIDMALRKIVNEAPVEVQEKFKRAGRMAHLFRHSRATHLAHEWKDPWMLRDFFGWSSLDMANHYVARSGREPQHKTPPVRTQKCPRCDYVTVMGHSFCPKCGEPLTDQAAQALAKRTSQIESQVERAEQAAARIERNLKAQQFFEAELKAYKWLATHWGEVQRECAMPEMVMLLAKKGELTAETVLYWARKLGEPQAGALEMYQKIKDFPVAEITAEPSRYTIKLYEKDKAEKEKARRNAEGRDELNARQNSYL